VWAVIVIFALTYVLIAARRLSILPIGRPAGALSGACAMVALGVVSPWGLTPKEAFGAVEPNTITLLLGMMLLSAALSDAGFFDLASAFILRQRPSAVALLHVVTIGAGVLSAFLVNDSVCLLLAPLVDGTAKRAGLPRAPYLFGLAMGSNAGSAMTLAGNPQNMLVAQLSAISYRDYLLLAGPAGLAALLVTSGMLHWRFRNVLSTVAAVPPAAVDHEISRASVAIPLACTALVSILFLSGAHLAWTALCGATLAMLFRGREPSALFSRVSWTVLLFFASLFVVVAGLQKTGLLAGALAGSMPHIPQSRLASLVWIGAPMEVACQIVSNVPFILLAESWIRSLPDQHLAWTATALFSTLAGNLTLLGSVANIIVAETTDAQHEFGFWSYLKVGAPIAIVSSVVAGGLLLWLA
jgi:Na+/H+ antiporter NhaD/arsenite permease-like protein